MIVEGDKVLYDLDGVRGRGTRARKHVRTHALRVGSRVTSGADSHGSSRHTLDATRALPLVQDGVISSMEYQLSSDALNDIAGPDLKGDGQVSAEEEKNTRILEGRKMILKNFIANNVHDLRNVGPRFARKTPKEVRRWDTGVA